MNDHRADESPREHTSLWQRLTGSHLPLETETARFVLVSALDVFITYLLIRRPDFTEGNPIARHFLYHWGVKGMVWFKFAMVAVVAVIAQIIARKKPAVARGLLNVATLIVAAVVAYSILLLIRSGGLPTIG